MKNLFLYIHVFRSAGTTFCEIMRRTAPKKFGRCHTKWFLGGRGKSAAEHLIAGHFCWGMHRFVSRPCQYVTILREPVDRILSNHFRSPEETPERVFNRMRERRLGGRPNIATSLIAGRSKEEIEAGFLTYIEKKLTQRDLDNAKAHLREMAFVGIVDELKSSIRHIQALAGFPQEGWCHENVSSHRPKDLVVPEDVQQIIREREWMDVELYKLATELYRAP